MPKTTLRKFKDGYLYFLKPVGERGPIKIGYSFMPIMRLELYSSWSPIPIEIVGQFPAKGFHEEFVQRKFKTKHSHREWFHWSLEIQQFIEALRAGADLDELIGDPKDLPLGNPKRRKRGPQRSAKILRFNAKDVAA